MNNIYAQLEIGNFASTSQLRAICPELVATMQTLKKCGDKQGFEEKRALHRQIVEFLRAPAQKEDYDLKLKQHFYQQKVLQERIRQDELADREEVERRNSPEFIVREAISTKNFDRLLEHGYLRCLSHQQIDIIKEMLAEVLEYYQRLMRNYPQYRAKLWGSLEYQIAHIPDEIVRRIEECKWEFDKALSHQKDAALRAADAKVPKGAATAQEMTLYIDSLEEL